MERQRSEIETLIWLLLSEVYETILQTGVQDLAWVQHR